MNATFTVEGKIVDLKNESIFPGKVVVEGERIIAIERDDTVSSDQYILPGFVDAHVHVESSMLVPSQFARLAVVHGTVATVSDPHEIANVCGMDGVNYMIDEGNTVPFKFYFGAPSCVPATPFETAGATIGVKDIDELLRRKEVVYLSEMMNFPAVLQNDPLVMDKIAAAKKYNKPVDGHAPGLRGEEARQYINAGMSTDHECFTAEEALDKLSFGMKILIREGSAAKNFEALAPLLHQHSASMMFCSDDKHPDSLVAGHINILCARAATMGIDPFKVLRAACLNPVEHYKLKVGLLRINDFADFIIVDNLSNFNVLATYINGQRVAVEGRSELTTKEAATINQFHASPLEPASLQLVTETLLNGNAGWIEKTGGSLNIQVIEALDGQLITNNIAQTVSMAATIDAVPQKDLLKIVVINRYRQAAPAIAFIKNFGLQRGAIASSVAHDSHNIVAVGADDTSLAKAINAVIKEKGGISCVDGEEVQVLPLPVAGLMSTADGYEVATAYAAMDAAAKGLGSSLSAPYMTLSFMALLVIPELKLSDLGLFDGKNFRLMHQAS